MRVPGVRRRTNVAPLGAHPPHRLGIGDQLAQRGGEVAARPCRRTAHPGPRSTASAAPGPRAAAPAARTAIASSTVSGHSPTEATTITSADRVDVRHLARPGPRRGSAAAGRRPRRAVAAGERDVVVVAGRRGHQVEALLRHEPARRTAPAAGPARAALAGSGMEADGVDAVAEHLDPRRPGRPAAMCSSIGRTARAPPSTSRPNVAEHHALHQPHQRGGVVHEADVAVHDVRRPQRQAPQRGHPAATGRGRRGRARRRRGAPRRADASPAAARRAGTGRRSAPRGRSTRAPARCARRPRRARPARPCPRCSRTRDPPAPGAQALGLRADHGLQAAEVRQHLVRDVQHARRWFRQGHARSMPSRNHHDTPCVEPGIVAREALAPPRRARSPRSVAGARRAARPGPPRRPRPGRAVGDPPAAGVRRAVLRPRRRRHRRGLHQRSRTAVRVGFAVDSELSEARTLDYVVTVGARPAPRARSRSSPASPPTSPASLARPAAGRVRRRRCGCPTRTARSSPTAGEADS